MINNEIWVSRASKTVCIAAMIVGAYVLFEYAALPLTVIMVAFLVSELIHPVASRIGSRVGLPTRAVAGGLVTLLLLTLATGFAIICGRLYSECKELITWLSQNSGKVSVIISYYASLMDRLPVLGAYFEEISKVMIKNLISFLATGIGKIIGSAVANSAQTVTWIVFFIASCIYVSVDRERIYGFFKSILPSDKKKWVADLGGRVIDISRSYVKAYVLIFALTFLEALVGLFILKSPYALLMSATVAAVDILPVLGSGAVFIPWAIISFLSGEGGFGVGLLILYGIITIARQIVEPKIIGNGVGIHPLAVIGALCVGTWLFGAKGVLAAPVCLIIIKAVYVGKTKKM